MPGRQPNVLLIMSDQHNAQVMGCAGDPWVHTPSLDRLAARGTMLSNLYCSAPLCVPSRISFLTGMLPSQNGVFTNDQIPNAARPTMLHAAGAAGYVPYLSGKLHAVGPDQLMGYSHREVGDHRPNYSGGVPAERGVLDQAMDPGTSSLRKTGPGRNAYQVKDEFAAEAVIDYLNRHAIERRGTGEPRPFFVSVGLMLPHQPYVALREDYDRYNGQVGLPRVANAPDVDNHPFLSRWRRATGLDAVAPEAVVRARTAYWAMIDRMDRIIGTILDTLDRLGMTEGTLIVYTSDHGEQAGEHGLWWKQTMLESAIRVPGLISWPGIIPVGTCHRVASLVDLNATILEAIGAPQLPRSVGRSMLGVLTRTVSEWKDLAIAEYCVDSGHYDNVNLAKGSYQRMVREGRYKIIDYGDEPPQLFDLIEDPDETHSLAADPVLQDVLVALTAQARTGWDPEQIRADLRVSEAELDIIREWVRVVQPTDHYRWAMNPQYNMLQEPEIALGDQALEAAIPDVVSAKRSTSA